MKPAEGRLQTGEHILMKILEDTVKAGVLIARFYDDYGSLDVTCGSDLRECDKQELEDAVNKVIRQNLEVRISEVAREQAADFPNITKIPQSLTRIRAVEIVGFDKRACKDPHVQNTSQISKFKIDKVEKAGKDRYRFKFSVC